MARRFCITEEQYKRIIGEGVKIDVPVVPKNGQTPIEAIKNTEGEIQNAGVSPTNVKEKFNVNCDGATVLSNLRGTEIVNKDTTTKNLTNDGEATPSATGSAIAENKLISKKELMENRLKALKKNSQLYTVKDFMNKIKK